MQRMNRATAASFRVTSPGFQVPVTRGFHRPGQGRTDAARLMGRAGPSDRTRKL